MADITALEAFQARMDEAVQAVADGNRTRFAELIGATENPKQVGKQWHSRGTIPAKYARALQALGLSIDYINHGEGKLLSDASPASQPGGLDVPRLTLMIECLEGALLDAKRELDPARKARIVSLIYADPGIGNTREAVQSALRVAFMAMG
ncbi:hypothetical protein [Pseudoxanthomonas sp. USHLN014]|uniref:hypothetical protein n=1 Tax=Pseudoxanthomonas sp. USHLN014 TaxID=3081297 RepID=UPI00301D98E0